MHSGRAGGSWTLLGRYQHVDLGTGRFKTSLSAKAGKALRAGPLVLSVVSFWEIVLKAQKGSLDFTPYTGGRAQWISAAASSSRSGQPTFRSSQVCHPFTRIRLTGC